MGCTSEKYIHESYINKNEKHIITDDNIEIDLHDIEKQGESKHPQKEININDEEAQQENNYYNYNLKDLTLVNDSKMTVKRIDNFDDDDESESDSNSEENNSQKIKEENNNDDNFDDNNKNEEGKIKQDENFNINEEKENQKIKMQEDIEKKPEDKKPPNIKKLRKKGKDKKEINIF